MKNFPGDNVSRFLQNEKDLSETPLRSRKTGRYLGMPDQFIISHKPCKTFRRISRKGHARACIHAYVRRKLFLFRHFNAP